MLQLALRVERTQDVEVVASAVHVAALDCLQADHCGRRARVQRNRGLLELPILYGEFVQALVDFGQLLIEILGCFGRSEVVKASSNQILMRLGCNLPDAKLFH